MAPQLRRTVIAIATVFGLLLSGLTASNSWATPSYPSAAEVEAAKKNVAKKKAMIARLDTIIGDLSEEESRLTEISQRKAEVYNQAQVKVDEIAAKVDLLQGQADSANAKAEEAQNQLGQIAAQMHRTGALGTSLNLFLNGGKADDLLYKLGTQERIAESSQTLYQRSIQTQKYAQSLSDQLSVAKAELALIRLASLKLSLSLSAMLPMRRASL